MRSLIQKIAQEDDKMDLMIRVHDTGIGMNHEFITRIFRPLEQESMEMAKILCAEWIADWKGCIFGCRSCKDIGTASKCRCDIGESRIFWKRGA